MNTPLLIEYCEIDGTLVAGHERCCRCAILLGPRHLYLPIYRDGAAWYHPDLYSHSTPTA